MKSNSASTSISSEQYSTTPTVSFVENVSEIEAENNEIDMKITKSNDNKKQKRSKKLSASGNRSITPTNSSISSTKSQKQNSQIELEKLEKQNWVKNYVDSDGGNTPSPNILSTETEEIKSDNSGNEMVFLKPEPKDEMMVSINSARSEDKSLENIDTSQTETSNTKMNRETFENVGNEVITTNNKSMSQLTEQPGEVQPLVVDIKEQPAKPETSSPTSTSSNISVEYSESNIPNKKEQSNKNKNIASLIDFVKVEGSSGNASSNEEHETCASEVLSDIEVLSLPSNSGDPKQQLNNDKLKKNPSARHSDSKNSQLISSSNVMQILVKSPPPINNNSNQGILKQMNSEDCGKSLSSSDVSANQVLAAREAHIIKLNTQNVKLQEENDNYINEFERIKYEFKERSGLMEQKQSELVNKLEKSNSEREHYKKTCADLQNEICELKAIMKEKDEQMEQLTAEGTKLSKQELNQSNIIKKLRSKEKENESRLNSMDTENKNYRKEIEELKKALDNKNESEKQNLDTFKKLEKGASLVEKELVSTKMAYEDSLEKIKSLENTLQNTFKELAELHRANAHKTSQINEATSSIENQYKEEIQTAVEKERVISGKKIDTLKWELECVRSDISRIEQQHSIRENMLRKEIADLQHQLRDTEMRNNELSQNISTATRPLLRQIENLQHSNSTQIESLENSEKNLIERLKEAQTNLVEMTEKNRLDQELMIDMEQKLKTFEVQIQSLKLEKSRLNAEFQAAKTTLENYENEKYEKESETKVLIGSLTSQNEKLTREKRNLEIQLDMEATKLENETKKFQTLLSDLNKERENQQKLIDKQLNLQQNYAATGSEGAYRMKRLSSGSVSLDTSGKSDSIDYVSLPQNSNLNVLEALQSKLKQKDGEINQLQKEINKLENVRESMAREMVNLSNNLENIKEQMKEYPELQKNYQNLNIEYNALLQMYGEKTEETEELKLDLQDVKEMYKLQIEDLIKRSNI